MFYFLKALISIIFPLTSIHAAEMIFGEEQLDNGIKIIFEAAPKDQIFPENKFLEENKTDIHIEMLINWSKENSFSSMHSMNIFWGCFNSHQDSVLHHIV